VSKPFVHALALAELGLEEVLRHVGAEPSGEAFNAISLERGSGRPLNPMINAGAIVTTSLLATDSGPGFERILAGLSGFAGRRLDIDEATFGSERETGDRNRALGYLMRAAGSLRSPVEPIVDAYFRQCSVLVTAADLAVMAATLANGGVNVKTGARVVGPAEAAQAVTVMATCGMYDYSGEWLLRAGLPAKSGVSGALLAVSPGQFGIGLFSPRVDAGGHSVRGGSRPAHHRCVRTRPDPPPRSDLASGAGARRARRRGRLEPAGRTRLRGRRNHRARAQFDRCR
jgi:glutaminase